MSSDTDHNTTGGSSSSQRTKLSRRWLLKTVITTIALLAFGSWALVDLAVLYPKRGEAYASAKQLEYLRAAESGRSLFQASIEDPKAELDRLEERAAGGTALTEVEQARLAWLEALAVPGLGLLTSEQTNMAAPRDTLRELEERFSTADQPKRLSAFDIPSQWVIMVICWGIAGYLLFLWVRVAMKTYTWDPIEMRLGLPGGKSIVPSDLDDVDKRKWHKFYVTLELNDQHESLAGEDVTLDLYRYVPLEEWVLEMEKVAFPDREEEEGEEAQADEDRAEADFAEDAAQADGESDGA